MPRSDPLKSRVQASTHSVQARDAGGMTGNRSSNSLSRSAQRDISSAVARNLQKPPHRQLRHSYTCTGAGDGENRRWASCFYSMGLWVTNEPKQQNIYDHHLLQSRETTPVDGPGRQGFRYPPRKVLASATCRGLLQSKRYRTAQVGSQYAKVSLTFSDPHT